MSSNLKVNSLVPATGTEIGIGTTGGSIDFRCPATFGGNVTIGGTLTYDEVINIDSIGIVTARSGLNVQAGQLDVGSNIKLGNAGVVTATSLDISGDIDVDGHTNLDNVSVVGVTTITANNVIGLNVENSSGSGAQTTIRSKSTVANASNFVRSESSDNKYIGLLKYGTGHSAYGALAAGGGAVYANSSVPITIMSDGGHINFATGGNTERLRITSDGVLKLTGQTSTLETAGLTHHTNNNLYIRGGTTGLVMQSVDGNEAWIVQNDYVSASTAGSERLRIDSSGNLLVGRTAWVDNHFDNGIYLAGSTQAGMKFMRTASGSAGTYDIGIDTDRAFKFVYAGDSGGTGTERLRIASDGVITAQKSASFGNTSDSFTAVQITSSTSGISELRFGDTTANAGYVKYEHSGNNLIFATNATERARIDSNGQLLVGTTTSGANVRAVFQGYNGGGENFQARVQFQTAQQTNLTTNQHLANLLFTNASSSTGAEIRVQADDNWGTSDYPTRISFLTTANGSGSRYERMIIKNDGVVNIGVASPQYAKKLNIQGDNGYTLSVSNQDYTGHAAGSLSGIEGRVQCGGGIWSGAGVRFVKHNGTSGDKHTRLELYANDGYASRNSLIIQPEGEITKPYQPSFRAGLSGNTTVNTNAYIVFNDTGSTWHHNIGNHYSTSNGRFTAPVDGVYQFNICVIFGPFSGTNNVFMGDAFLIYVNGGNAGYSGRRGYYISGDSGNNYYTDHMSVNLKLSATDYVQIRNGAPFTAIHGNTYYTWFAGTLLG